MRSRVCGSVWGVGRFCWAGSDGFKIEKGTEFGGDGEGAAGDPVGGCGLGEYLFCCWGRMLCVVVGFERAEFGEEGWHRCKSWAEGCR